MRDERFPGVLLHGLIGGSAAHSPAEGPAIARSDDAPLRVLIRSSRRAAEPHTSSLAHDLLSLVRLFVASPTLVKADPAASASRAHHTDVEDVEIAIHGLGSDVDQTELRARMLELVRTRPLTDEDSE